MRVQNNLSESHKNDDIWSSDILGRKKYAEFLTNYLIRKTAGSNNTYKPFIIALDAKWGAGKTYFITKWQQDLENNTNHPTFIFDAWKADYHTDPLLAFISAFKSAVDKEINDLNLAEKIKTKVNNSVRKGLKKFQAALLPVAKSIAIGLANKATSGAIDEISEQIQNRSFEIDFAEIEKNSLDELGETLEKCFEKTLQEQSAKEKLFEEFRTSISDALTTLCEHSEFKLPFIIFVDEIDRCRPNFSLELLESLKHLFDIPGLCFVVSTNLDQLSHSVNGVYGSNFDGRGYLQRFFDAEYSLPLPNNESFAKLLIEEFFPELPKDMYLGLPEKGFLGQEGQNAPYLVLAWVAEVFDLDLRTLRKQIELIDASIGSINSKYPIHFMWLSLLSAMRIKAPDLFDLIEKRNIDIGVINNLWSKAAVNDREKSFSSPTSLYNQSNVSQTTVFLRDVFLTYYENSSQELIELRNRRQSRTSNIYDYPDSIIQKILNEAPSSYMSNQSYYSSVMNYHELIRCAGHLAE